MTPTSAPEFNNIIREFLHAMRAKVAEISIDDNAEELIERIFAAGAAVAAAVLMVIPRTRNKGVWISSLLALAVRLFTRKERNARHQKGAHSDHVSGE